MAADRFTFPQDLLVTDSIAVYDTSNHNFCRKMILLLSLFIGLNFIFLFSVY